MGMRRTWPSRSPRVNGVRADSTRRKTVVQQNRSERFRSIAPGSSPTSSSTWNPLQMPSTGPPRAANARTADMIGAVAATAPARR